MPKQRRKFTQCPNCTHTFEEVNNYCPNCGQENHDLNVPLKHLIWEFLEGTLHYDTKFWKTLKYLLFKPGYLTEKFNLGQRASYVPPFRLYVFVSLVFFTALAFRSQNNVKAISDADIQKAMSEAFPEMQATDSLKTQNIETSQLTGSNNQDVTSSQFIEKFKRFTKSENSKQKLLKNTSFMMFILMPFFGFILYIIYRKQRRNYVEHLMFSIHFHTFFFLIIILSLIIEYIFKGFNVDAWVFWIAGIYMFFALRHVYKQSYFLTLLNMIPIAFLYLLSSIMFIIGTIGISILFS